MEKKVKAKTNDVKISKEGFAERLSQLETINKDMCKNYHKTYIKPSF
jgi:hypothetical protein